MSTNNLRINACPPYTNIDHCHNNPGGFTPFSRPASPEKLFLTGHEDPASIHRGNINSILGKHSRCRTQQPAFTGCLYALDIQQQHMCSILLRHNKRLVESRTDRRKIINADVSDIHRNCNLWIPELENLKVNQRAA